MQVDPSVLSLFLFHILTRVLDYLSAIDQFRQLQLSGAFLRAARLKEVQERVRVRCSRLLRHPRAVAGLTSLAFLLDHDLVTIALVALAVDTYVVLFRPVRLRSLVLDLTHIDLKCL